MTVKELIDRLNILVDYGFSDYKVSYQVIIPGDEWLHWADIKELSEPVESKDGSVHIILS